MSFETQTSPSFGPIYLKPNFYAKAIEPKPRPDTALGDRLVERLMIKMSLKMKNEEMKFESQSELLEKDRECSL